MSLSLCDGFCWKAAGSDFLEISKVGLAICKLLWYICVYMKHSSFLEVDEVTEQNKFLLVDLSVLPEVFTKVVEAKRYMAQGKAKSYSDAAKMAGISRSAFYKYKDKVYAYENNSLTRMLTLNVMLLDEPGILSSLITGLYRIGANIVTINQNIPADGVAPVSVSLRIDRDRSDEEVVSHVQQIEGVVSVRTVNA